jgi:hypothetical protein
MAIAMAADGRTAASGRAGETEVAGPRIVAQASQQVGSERPSNRRAVRRTTSLGWLSVLLVGIATHHVAASNADHASQQPFSPIRQLTSWYTDRNLVDVEIVGSTSMLPEFHRLEPERVLRFRLERAYIDTLMAKENPGFEILGLSFDRLTSLPSSLFFAATVQGKYHEEIPGIPALSNQERVRRLMNISISSDASELNIRRASAFVRKCAGSLIGENLWIYETTNRQFCHESVYNKGKQYVGQYEDDLNLRIECQEPGFPGVGCQVMFPFQGFSVRLNFHHDYLRNWRDMISNASDFLKSKEYHGR